MRQPHGGTVRNPWQSEGLTLYWNFDRDRSQLGFGGRWRKTVREQTTEFHALIERHIHEFERHILRAIIAKQRSSLQRAKSKLQFQLHGRAGMHVAVNRGDATGEARGFDFEPAIFLEVRAYRGHRLAQTDTRVTALAHESTVVRHLERS